MSDSQKLVTIDRKVLPVGVTSQDELRLLRPARMEPIRPMKPASEEALRVDLRAKVLLIDVCSGALHTDQETRVLRVED